jgi:hypothetical protein
VPDRAAPGSDAARQIARTAQRSISLESLARIDFQPSVTSTNPDFNRSGFADNQIQSSYGSQTNLTPSENPQPVEGMKGKLQVIGSMWITDERPANFVPNWRHNLFYDAASPKSVLFTNSGSPEKIEEVSSYLNNRFNQAFRSNFHGEKGLHPMEADVVRGFEKLLRDYETVQFMEGIKEALG